MRFKLFCSKFSPQKPRNSCREQAQRVRAVQGSLVFVSCFAAPMKRRRIQTKVLPRLRKEKTKKMNLSSVSATLFPLTASPLLETHDFPEFVLDPAGLTLLPLSCFSFLGGPSISWTTLGLLVPSDSFRLIPSQSVRSSSRSSGGMGPMHIRFLMNGMTVARQPVTGREGGRWCRRRMRTERRTLAAVMASRITKYTVTTDIWKEEAMIVIMMILVMTTTMKMMLTTTTRERERERQTDRQRETDRQKDRQRQTDRQRQKKRQTGRQKQTDRQRQTGRDRQTDRQRQTGRDRQADRQKQRERQRKNKNTPN